jgi:microcystin-dependent protein
MGLGTNTPLVGCIRAYAGTVTDSGAQEVPTSGSGWLYCNGAAVSRTTYDDLFAQIGTTYGVGDGSTTFNLPDMRGRFPIGLNLTAVGNINSGVTGGAATVTLGATETPSHGHSISLTAAGTHSHSATSTSNSEPDPGTWGYSIGLYAVGTGHRDGAGASLAVGISENGSNGTVAGSYPQGPATSGFDANHTHNVTLASDSTHIAAHTLTMPSEGGGGSHDNMPPYLALNFVVKY